MTARGWFAARVPIVGGVLSVSVTAGVEDDLSKAEHAVRHISGRLSTAAAQVAHLAAALQ